MMDLILVKIFATALALSEVMTQPQAVKTHFDAVADQDKVVQTLRAGCAHMRRAFDIESINVDELISTALNDQKAVGTGIKAFHGINFADLNVAYHRFCKNENVGDTVVDLRQVIEFFNDAAADLPDHARLKGRKLPSMTAILDGKGANFADVFEPSNRRIWVSLDDIPDSVQKPLWPPRTGGSTSIMAWTSAASSAPSWAISANRAAPRAARPSRSRW
jgi:penicillin-binding protein 1A